MKLILFTLGVLLGTTVLAAEGQYSGIDLARGNALQMNLCSLNSGKSMANYNRVFDSYVEWSKENDVEVFAIRATPIFQSANQGGAPDFDFIDMMISPYEVSGSAWTKWLGTEEGRKINAQWVETADCRVAINAAFIQFIDREALSNRDDRVMAFNWCTRNEGVSSDQMIAKHQQLASNLTTDSPIKAWTIMFPGLGSRGTPGEFAHLLSFEDASGLMAWQNGTANDGGWRLRQDYETSYADCIGENVYAVEVLHRPGM